MEKKKYIKPETETIRVSLDGLMITASPGVSNEEFDPDNDEIGAKKGSFFFDEEDEGWVKPGFNAWED